MLFQSRLKMASKLEATDASLTFSEVPTVVAK